MGRRIGQLIISPVAFGMLVYSLYELSTEGVSARLIFLALAAVVTWVAGMFGFRRSPADRQANIGEDVIVTRSSPAGLGRKRILVGALVVTYWLTAWSWRPELNIYLAKGADEKGDEQIAIDQLTAAVTSPFLPESRLAEVLKLRADAWIDLSYETQDGDTGFYKGLQDYNRALELFPKDADGLRARARAYFLLGGYDETFADLEQATALEGKGAFWPIIRKAAYLKEMGEFDAAMAVFQELFDRFGTDANMPIYYNMAQTLMAMERPAEAEKAINSGLPAQSDYSWAYFYRGCARARQGKLEEALADYQHGFEIWDENTKDVVVSEIGQFNQSQLKREVQAIQDALADPAGPQPIADTCRKFWDDLHSVRRDRSPLLDEQSGD